MSGQNRSQDYANALSSGVNLATLPKTDLQPPSYGEAQRQAIDSVVKSMTNDICTRTNMLRKQLDQIDQLVLESAAKSKQQLTDTVTLCVKLSDEISHTQDVIADLKTLAEASR